MSEELYLEKLRIDARLASLETLMKSDLESREAFRQDMRRMLDKHEHTLYGNAKDGLEKEVDRLKQSEKRTTWVWVTIAGLAIKQGWDFIVKK